MNKKKKKLGFKLIILSLIFLPILQVLFIIGINSNYLIRFPFFIVITILIILFLVTLLYGTSLFVKNRNSSKRRLKKWLKITLSIILAFYILGSMTFIGLLYGPNEKFKTWLVTTAMQTKNHQYLCKWFYNEKTIQDVMDKNYVKESGESTDASLIGKDKTLEYNEYERELLIHDEDEKFKIVKFSINNADAYIAAVFDPSMLRLAVTKQLGVKGEYVTSMAQRYNAILAINGGGFKDNGSSLGESPTGITIQDGQIITNNKSGLSKKSGGIIGITNDNVLVLLKDTTAKEAIALGVRDAVSWGPFLIVNGVASSVSGNGGWGGGARTAIGQRRDGTILFLVVDSNSRRTTGAGMQDLVQIMQRYGAYNAANLDGGTSSVMVVPRDEAKEKYGADCHDYFTRYACSINDPIDSTGTHQTRFVSDAWVVVDSESGLE